MQAINNYRIVFNTLKHHRKIASAPKTKKNTLYVLCVGFNVVIKTDILLLQFTPIHCPYNDIGK